MIPALPHRQQTLGPGHIQHVHPAGSPTGTLKSKAGTSALLLAVRSFPARKIVCDSPQSRFRVLGEKLLHRLKTRPHHHEEGESKRFMPFRKDVGGMHWHITARHPADLDRLKTGLLATLGRTVRVLVRPFVLKDPIIMQANTHTPVISRTGINIDCHEYD